MIVYIWHSMIETEKRFLYVDISPDIICFAVFLFRIVTNRYFYQRPTIFLSH